MSGRKMQSAKIYEDPSHCNESHELSQEIDFAVNGYLLSNGEVFRFPPLISVGLTQIQCISCNSSLTLANNSQGQVFGWGNDSYGLLGYGPQTHSSPISVKNIQNISKCSLGTDHAAAIDQSGALFTWSPVRESKLGDTAFEECTPKAVQSARLYKIVDVACGDNYTCIRTDGCYLQVYGSIGKNHQVRPNYSPRKSITISQLNKGPYSNPRLDAETVVQVLGCKEFIAVRLESGDVYVFDSCFLLSMLNHNGKSVDSIVGNDSCIWGITKNEVFTWNRSRNLCGPLECPVKNWESNEYSVEENCSVWEWGDRFLVASTNGKVFENMQKEHHLKIIINRGSLLSPLESPGIAMKDRLSPRASFESLQRLFSKGNNDQLIEKIMKCRAEFSNRGTLLEAFKGLVHPMIRDAISQMKKYSQMKKTYYMYMNSIHIFRICDKLMRNRIASKFCQWTRVITFEKYSKSKNSKINQIFSRSYSKFRNNLIWRLCALIDKKFIECQRKGFGRFKVFCRINIKRRKALERILSILQHTSINYYFSIWRQGYENYYKKKASIGAFAEILKRTIQIRIFEILLKESLQSNKTKKSFNNGFIQLSGIVRLIEMKLTINSLKKLISNTAKQNAKHKIAYDSFPRILSLKLTKILSNSLQNLFQHLKIKSNLKGKPLKMILTLRNISKRITSIFFKCLLPRFHFSKKAILKLSIFLSKKSKSTLSKILLLSKQSSSRILSSFFLIINAIKARTDFCLKLSSLRSIKDHSGYPNDSYIGEFYEGLLLESLNNSSDSYSSNSASNNPPYQLNIKSMHLVKSESSLTTLPINDAKHDQSSSNLSPRSNISRHKASFQSGELLRYQQYLIKKKKLAMIREDYSGSETDRKISVYNQSTKHEKRRYKRKSENYPCACEKYAIL